MYECTAAGAFLTAWMSESSEFEVFFSTFRTLQKNTKVIFFHCVWCNIHVQRNCRQTDISTCCKIMCRKKEKKNPHDRCK